MDTWTVTLHPLAEPELLALPADMQARFLHIAELLQDCGPQRVGLPHIRPLESKLWEMRMQGRDGIAIDQDGRGDWVTVSSLDATAWQVVAAVETVYRPTHYQ